MKYSDDQQFTSVKAGLINAIQTYNCDDRAQFDQFIFALMQKGYLKLIALFTLSNQLSVEEARF
jgi:hypothetical protein